MLSDPPEPRRPALVDALLPTLTCFVVLTASVLIGGLVDSVLTQPGAVPAHSAFLAHAIAAQCGLLAAMAAALALQPSRSTFAGGRGSAAATLAGIAAALGINAAGSWLMSLTGEAYLGLPSFPGLGWNLAIVIVAGVTAPWIEELFFREALLMRLLASAPRGYALALSSIAFGALHLPAGGLVLFLTMTSLGAVFGWLRLRTGSLAPAIAAHAANNFSALFVAWVSGSGGAGG